MKIDLRKAYDSVSWDFLGEMMEFMKFLECFKRWIMTCVTNPAYSIMLNGSLHGYIKGKKGLRQGDPLSPLLFTICMEYLSRLLRHVSEMEGFLFHSMCASMKLCHLVFADDLLIFSKGNFKSVFLLLRAFATFSSATGLAANVAKSSIYTCNMAQDDVKRLKDASGFSLGSLPFKYLGIPDSAKN